VAVRAWRDVLGHGAGYIPFWVAIVAVVVGLLVATGGFVIGYDLVWGQRSIELLRASYLDQVADTAEKEVEWLARIGVQALLAQRYPLRDGILLDGRRCRPGPDHGRCAPGRPGHRGHHVPGRGDGAGDAGEPS
jgi:hypothetical protein